jgi:hypothetical protein
MARYHGLDQEHRIEIGVNGKIIERVTQWKVLGMLFQQMWNNHIAEHYHRAMVVSACWKR